VTLRVRLLVVLMGIVLVGLLVSDVVTYKSLQSFLVSRLDQQLENSPNQAARALENCVRQQQSDCSVASVPSVPADTFAELLAPGSPTFSAWFLPSSTLPKQPTFPSNLPESSLGNPTVFSVTSSSGLGYHAVAVPVTNAGPLAAPPGTVVVVAVPLTDVNQTLGRLFLVEILVSVSVLAVLGALAWWIVRAGLRPLDEMTETAGAIAAGDLTQRVPQGDNGTEVGRLGQALNVMLEEIEESFAARTASEERLRRFLADASHELRTPLTSIRGYAEMFDRGARDRPDDLAMSMRHIRADADRMSTLVDDLLVLARLGRERPLAHELVDLRDVVQPAVAAISVQEPERAIVVKAPEPVIVVGDTGRLRQVVDNLLVNAVRHTPAGSPIELDLDEQSGSAVLSVLDRGAGIPPEQRERIFEPFFRADPSRSRATGGQGLGLAIVSTIVQAHGGQVGVSPREGGGARFWVQLPVSSPESMNGSGEDGPGVQGPADGDAATGDTATSDPAASDRAMNGRDDTRSSGSGEARVPVVAPSSRNAEADRSQQ
jgi:two-component system OmpR family sensor kinase